MKNDIQFKNLNKIQKTMEINNNYEVIYKRIYDNPYNPDGTEKENEVLGEFKIIETLYEDMYCSQKIGILKNTDRVFIINEYEVKGYNGGSRFEIYESKSLKQKEICNLAETFYKEKQMTIEKLEDMSILHSKEEKIKKCFCGETFDIVARDNRSFYECKNGHINF